jgi:hypothetical protein
VKSAHSPLALRVGALDERSPAGIQGIQGLGGMRFCALEAQCAHRKGLATHLHVGRGAVFGIEEQQKGS